MAENKVQLSKSDRMSVCMRHQFLQGSWNYERMQNGGWCFAMIPAIKKLYSNKEDQIAALKRHMEFYNTHPYVSAPVIGVTLALEEDRANGAQVEDAAIQGVKVGMMGPLAGVGDPVFWFTLRPILGALGASLALGGSIMGPLLFFFAWNIASRSFGTPRSSATRLAPPSPRTSLAALWARSPRVPPFWACSSSARSCSAG